MGKKKQEIIKDKKVSGKKLPIKKRKVKVAAAKKKNLPAVKENNQLPSIKNVSENTIDEYLFGTDTKLTDQQKVLFKKTAIMFNLNPFKREVYAIPFGNRMGIVTGYEVYLKKANSLRLLSGWNVSCEGNGNDMKAVVTIHRKDWEHSFIHEVFFREYNQENAMWKKKPITMIKKVAMAQGFRLCFTEEFSGMPYTTDEMPLKDRDYDTPDSANKSDEVIPIEDKQPTIDRVKEKFGELCKLTVPNDALKEFMSQIEVQELSNIVSMSQRLDELIKKNIK